MAVCALLLAECCYGQGQIVFNTLARERGRAGQRQYKVFAANSRGNGPESDVAVVAVAAQAVA